MRAAISPRFATMSRRIATACTLCRAVTVSVRAVAGTNGWMHRLCTRPCCDLRGGDSRHERVRGRFRRLRHPGRCLAPSTAPARSRSASPRCRASGSTSSASPCAGMRSRRRRDTFDWAGTDAVLEQLHSAGIDAVVTLYGTPRVGERRQGPERGSDPRGRLRRVRRRGGRALPVRAPLDDLERAEPAPLAVDGLAGAVRDPAAQPGVCGDPRSVAVVAGGRRRHRSARRHRRAVAGRVHPRDGVERRAPRRLRASSVRALGPRRRRGAAAATTARRSRWRRSTAS